MGAWIKKSDDDDGDDDDGGGDGWMVAVMSIIHEDLFDHNDQGTENVLRRETENDDDRESNVADDIADNLKIICVVWNMKN